MGAFAWSNRWISGDDGITEQHTMTNFPDAISVLSAMITPAVLISACGSLILATSARFRDDSIPTSAARPVALVRGTRVLRRYQRQHRPGCHHELGVYSSSHYPRTDWRRLAALRGVLIDKGIALRARGCERRDGFHVEARQGIRAARSCRERNQARALVRRCEVSPHALR